MCFTFYILQSHSLKSDSWSRHQEGFSVNSCILSRVNCWNFLPSWCNWVHQLCCAEEGWYTLYKLFWFFVRLMMIKDKGRVFSHINKYNHFCLPVEEVLNVNQKNKLMWEDLKIWETRCDRDTSNSFSTTQFSTQDRSKRPAGFFPRWTAAAFCITADESRAERGGCWFYSRPVLKQFPVWTFADLWNSHFRAALIRLRTKTWCTPTHHSRWPHTHTHTHTCGLTRAWNRLESRSGCLLSTSMTC